MKISVLLASLIFLTLNAFAGDVPKVHFTGNPQVDLFSARNISIPTVVWEAYAAMALVPLLFTHRFILKLIQRLRFRHLTACTGYIRKQKIPGLDLR